MALAIICPGCQATLHVRDEYAGKDMKCPRCAATVSVPTGQLPAAAIQQVRPVPAIPETRPTPARAAGEQTKACPKCGRPIAAAARKCRYCKAWLEEEDKDDDDEDESGHSPYKPCPRCGARGATRIVFTFWGSFYGPALFTHVRCPECGCAYNGKTGRSNLIPAIIFVTVPALLIFAIIGGLTLFIMRLPR